METTVRSRTFTIAPSGPPVTYELDWSRNFNLYTCWKADYDERFNQIKIWSEKIYKNVKVLGGTRGGLTEIICNHERTSLEDNEKNISVFVALEALRSFIVRVKKSKTKLYVSENIMNILNFELKKQINEIKNFAKFTEILIDKNLGYNNFYIE